MKSTQWRGDRRSHRRLFAIMAGATAIGAVLAGCSGAGSNTSTGQISVMNRWSDPVSKAAATELFNGFTKETGIKVQNSAQPNSGSTYQPGVRTAESSSNPPTFADDISGPEVYNFAKSGVIKDISSYYDSSLKSRELGGATTGSTYKGKVFGISSGYKVGNLIWFNPVYLKKFGIDASSIQSFDDMLAAMKKIKDAGGNPAVIGAKDQWPGGHYLNNFVQRALGSKATQQLYDRSVLGGQPDSPKWTDPEVVSALKDYVKLKPYFQDGFLGEAQASADALFLKGDVGFYEMGSWFLNTIQTAKPSFTPGVMLFPTLADGKGKGTDITIANSTLIMSSKANANDAEKFLEYFTRPDVAAKFGAQSLTLMPYKTDSKAAGKVDPQIKPQWDTISGFVKNTGADGSALYNDQGIDVNIYTKYIWQGSVGLMSGDITPEQLAQQLETATEAAQKANG
jgi:raffinose/stachyose/melibiose transport system substrate-binding protein